MFRTPFRPRGADGRVLWFGIVCFEGLQRSGARFRVASWLAGLRPLHGVPPLRGSRFWGSLPRAYALGYPMSPLCGLGWWQWRLRGPCLSEALVFPRRFSFRGASLQGVSPGSFFSNQGCEMARGLTPAARSAAPPGLAFLGELTQGLRPGLSYVAALRLGLVVVCGLGNRKSGITSSPIDQRSPMDQRSL